MWQGPLPGHPPPDGLWVSNFDAVESCGLSDFVFTVSSFSMLGELMGTLLRSIESNGIISGVGLQRF